MRGQLSIFCLGLGMNLLLVASPGWCETPSKSAQDLDISPEIIKKSPVLQRWRRRVPNVLSEIQNDPSFRTQIRLGYSRFTSGEEGGGINFGVENVFIGRSGLTVGAEYESAFNGKHKSYGADLYYYLRPLGSYVNFAPLVGYQYLRTSDNSTDGVNIGIKLLLALSRGGAADISVTQSWISPGSEEEVGLTTAAIGYAITRNLRLSTAFKQRTSQQDQDSSVGVGLEWMP